MRRDMSLIALFAIVIGIMLMMSPAHAQATRTWVSGVGDDVNPCSRTAPCKTFAGAISKTAAGGEINCIDAGAYGTVTITKSMIIDCENVQAGVLASGSNGIVVNAAATDVVVLRGLDITSGSAVPSLNGILFNNGASLHVEKCRIREYQAGGTNGFGILFQPTGTAELYVTESDIVNNGTGSTGGAIMVRPTGSGAAKAVVNRVHANNNATGITSSTASTTGDAFIIARDSVAVGSTATGFAAISPGGANGNAGITLDRSASFNNATGISSSGSKSFIVLSFSTITNNATGLSATSSGQILSFQNNTAVGNVTPGAPTGTLSPI